MDFVVKNEIFCIFFIIFLHNSKKYSTFAVDFEF